MARRHLLIDGDVLAYQAACAVEVAIEWEPGYWTWHCDFDETVKVIEQEIAKYLKALDADGYTLCLTDDERNFRKDILPTYKGNRKQKKPLVLKAVREWMVENLLAYVRPGLEGDDIMGILATRRSFMSKCEKVIVSIDKDMKTIPCRYVRDLQTGMIEVDEPTADFNFLMQTLSGDVTDDYPGCPGIGPKRAERLLEDSGVHPPFGTVAEAWHKVIVPTYEKAKLSEDAALQQARVARILRAEDYDFKNRKPKLWKP